MAGRYDETESIRLLPGFMRRDAFDAAFSGIVDEFGADASAKTRPYSVWDRVDELAEADLDALAEELNVLWYDKAADVESKRGVIKNCKHIQAKLGTKWALEEILGLYFDGGAVVSEWFEYGGEPNHFTIESEAFSGDPEDAARFLAIMSQVKRKSAVLDGVVAAVGARAEERAAAWLQGARTDEMTARR